MMQLLDIIVILIYFGTMIVIGVYGSMKAKTTEEYVLAGRNLGFFMFFGCMAAVILGGASTIGTAKLGYQYGISGMWFVVMIGLGILLLGIFMIKPLFGEKVKTISELLGKRYNTETRYLSAVVASIYTLMVSVTQVIGMGTIFHAVLGWDNNLSMLTGGGIVLFYTLLGGMWSVTITDIIQFVIKATGIFVIMLPMSLHAAGGWSNLVSKLPSTHFDLTHIGLTQILQYFLLYTLGLIISQDIWQRAFTAKTEKISRTGSISAGVFSIAYAIAISIIGMCGVVIIPNIDNPQNIFAAMALKILPPGVLGLVLACVCSALMSTSSGTLLASSTLITNDILKPFFFKNADEKRLMTVSRVVTLLVGLTGIVFALWIQDVLDALDVAYAILSGAIFVPVVLGFFWKRATAKAGFYSIIISTLVIIAGLAIEGIKSTNSIMYGIATSFFAMIILSLITTSKEVVVNKETAKQELS